MSSAGNNPGNNPGDSPPASAAPQPPDVDFAALRPGQTIGRYEIVSVLGQGGFGITYRARDVQLGREVAIKEYLPMALAYREAGTTVMPRTTKLADDFGWGRERFVSEGRTLATLHRTPAIVHVFDFLEANGTAYIVMELLSGETLEDRLKRQGKLTPEEVDRILWPLLEGLQQVHEAGFLHRDIKPANILLDDAGNPTLIDFGASRAAMAGRTAAMTAIFTPGYAAAEQMTSAKQGPYTDIYGLSATLYHAITGNPPPSAFDRMLDDSYEPLARLRPAGFVPGLLAGLDAGLGVTARERPQSVAAWRPLLGMTAAPQADATVVVGKGPPTVAPATASTVSPPHVPVVAPASASAATDAPRSRAGLWAVLGLLLVALAGGGGYYVYGSRGPDPETVRARAAAEQAESARKAAEEKAAQLQADADKRRKEEEQAAERLRQEAAQAEAKRKLEVETRQKIEAEIAEQHRAEEAAKDKARQEEEARKAALEEARKAIEFVAGDFDHFGASLMMIALKGQAKEIRLQGVDIVDDPALLKLGVNALAAQPRNLHCRQTDRLTDGTPLYRCLVTQLNATPPLADIPDSDRSDLALALVRNGLVLASCDAPRSYADAEDDARSRNLSLWGRVKAPEYKRRCTR